MPHQTQNARDPFRLRTTLRHGGKELPVAVIPDRLFALVYPDVQHHFALEQDMGSMDIWASRLVGKSSMRRKLLAYAHAREQNRFVDTWNCQEFSCADRHDIREQNTNHARSAAEACC